MNVTASAPDIAVARLLALASLNASRKNHDPSTPVELPGWQIADGITSYRSGLPELVGFAARQPGPSGSDMLVFAASDDTPDPLAGLPLRTVPCQLPGATRQIGWAAQGILDAYASPFGGNPMCASVRLIARSFRHDRPLLIGGHGLGGALSTLALFDLLTNTDYRPTRIEHFTFGAPPVGDAEFADAFDRAVLRRGASYRVVNLADPVPALAEATRDPRGYRHTGRRWSFNAPAGDAAANHSLTRAYIPVLAEGSAALTLD